MKTENSSNAAAKANPKHDIFIREIVRHGDKARAYKAAYPGVSDAAARTAAVRLLGHPYIKQQLKHEQAQIMLGVKEDKAAFINQELKIINVKREMLLKIITGVIKSTIAERIKAIRLDTELAEQQAKLLGYGSLKQADVPKVVTKENTESVTNMNNEELNSSTIQPAKPAADNERTGYSYIGGISYPVTNYTGYSCSRSDTTDPNGLRMV